jgi:signal transduction histidine kinase
MTAKNALMPPVLNAFCAKARSLSKSLTFDKIWFGMGIKVNNDEVDKTQGVAATFAHELASPLGALSYSLEMLKLQIKGCLSPVYHPFFEQGLAAKLIPTVTVGGPAATDKTLRRKALAIAKAPEMEKLTEGLSGEKLDEALKCFEAGFSLKCSLWGIESGLKIIKNLRHWGNWKDFIQENVSLTETLSMAWAVVGHRCSNLRITWRLGDDLHLTANPHALTQVWSNLMLNASQTSSDNVAMIISMTQTDGQATLNFENNGPLFPKGLHLFERGQTTKKEGSGLGLYLCREIIRKHKGDIIASNLEHGVRFTITLPLC